jgi:hypothetical protein
MAEGSMADEDGIAQEAMQKLLAHVSALDEIVCLLLAEHVQRTIDPMDSLRMLSNRLSRKLAAADEGAGADHRRLSDIEQEFDRIIATARDILG